MEHPKCGKCGGEFVPGEALTVLNGLVVHDVGVPAAVEACEARAAKRAESPLGAALSSAKRTHGIAAEALKLLQDECDGHNRTRALLAQALDLLERTMKAHDAPAGPTRPPPVRDADHQREIDERREKMAEAMVREIATVEEGKRTAAAWIVTAAQHSANEDYFHGERDEHVAFIQSIAYAADRTKCGFCGERLAHCANHPDRLIECVGSRARRHLSGRIESDLNARLDRLQRDKAAAEQLHEHEVERRQRAEAELVLVKTPHDHVWMWQGKDDDVASLACPVVMSAETARSLFADRDAAIAKAREADERMASWRAVLKPPRGGTWRVVGVLGRTIYVEDVFVAIADTRELASAIVDAMNARPSESDAAAPEGSA